MPPRRIAQLSSRKVIYAAIVGNLLVAGTKFGAAAWTGSSAMLSEAVHSLVDTGNSLLLLYGLHRAKRSPDHDHPLGYGREIYFWSFVVAVLVFALGAGVSLYEGSHMSSIPGLSKMKWLFMRLLECQHCSIAQPGGCHCALSKA